MDASGGRRLRRRIWQESFAKDIGGGDRALLATGQDLFACGHRGGTAATAFLCAVLAR
jgi:hypothetical protein